VTPSLIQKTISPASHCIKTNENLHLRWSLTYFLSRTTPCGLSENDCNHHTCCDTDSAQFFAISSLDDFKSEEHYLKAGMRLTDQVLKRKEPASTKGRASSADAISCSSVSARDEEGEDTDCITPVSSVCDDDVANYRNEGKFDSWEEMYHDLQEEFIVLKYDMDLIKRELAEAKRSFNAEKGRTRHIKAVNKAMDKELAKIADERDSLYEKCLDFEELVASKEKCIASLVAQVNLLIQVGSMKNPQKDSVIDTRKSHSEKQAVLAPLSLSKEHLNESQRDGEGKFGSLVAPKQNQEPKNRHNLTRISQDSPSEEHISGSSSNMNDFFGGSSWRQLSDFLSANLADESPEHHQRRTLPPRYMSR
jgi:hypothetical protein